MKIAGPNEPILKCRACGARFRRSSEAPKEHCAQCQLVIDHVQDRLSIIELTYQRDALLEAAELTLGWIEVECESPSGFSIPITQREALRAAIAGAKKE